MCTGHHIVLFCHQQINIMERNNIISKRKSQVCEELFLKKKNIRKYGSSFSDSFLASAV